LTAHHIADDVEFLGRQYWSCQIDRFRTCYRYTEPSANRFHEAQGQLITAEPAPVADIQLDQVKDADLIMRSTLERRTLYRSMRMAEPRYVRVQVPHHEVADE